MKKYILLFTLVLHCCMSIHGQCPPMIIDADNGSGLYYDVPMSTNTACLAAVTALGATVMLNGQPYDVSATSCVGDPLIINLSSNGTPVILSAGSVTIPWDGSTCVYNTMGVLPVELLSFTGKQQNNINLLTWTTASESQNNGFDIEASPNPSKGGELQWRKIGFVAGNGTTNTKQDYRFEDRSSFSSPLGRSGGAVYYRLKQLDFDGRFEYSKIIAIDRKGENVVSVFPNPSNGIFTITGIEDTEEETFTLINSIGQTLSINVQNDGQLDMSAYPSGVYYLRVASSGQVMKLVKE